MFRRKGRFKIWLTTLIAILLLSAIGFLISNSLETSPPPPKETPTPGETPPALAETPTSGIRTLTVTDEDLPKPPIEGLTFHFLLPAEHDPGPGKIQAKYLGMISWSVWFGISEGKLWLYHVPRRESLPQFLDEFYDYIGIDEHSVYTEADGKYWVTAIPPWLDLAKYDEDITELPTFISMDTRDSEATITYMLRQ